MAMFKFYRHLIEAVTATGSILKEFIHKTDKIQYFTISKYFECLIRQMNGGIENLCSTWINKLYYVYNLVTYVDRSTYVYSVAHLINIISHNTIFVNTYFMIQHIRRNQPNSWMAFILLPTWHIPNAVNVFIITGYEYYLLCLVLQNKDCEDDWSSQQE